MKLCYSCVALLSVFFIFCGRETKTVQVERNDEADIAVIVNAPLEQIVTVQRLEKKTLNDKASMMQESPLYEVLVNTKWFYVGSGGERLRFREDMTWTLTDFHGLGEFVQGTYITGDA